MSTHGGLGQLISVRKRARFWLPKSITLDSYSLLFNTKAVFGLSFSATPTCQKERSKSAVEQYLQPLRQSRVSLTLRNRTHRTRTHHCISN